MSMDDREMWRTRRGFLYAWELYGLPHKRVRPAFRRWSWLHVHRHLKPAHRPQRR